MEQYIRRAKELDIYPNFFLSHPYLQICNVALREEEGWIWIEEEGRCLFPPLPVGRDSTFERRLPVSQIWSSFVFPPMLPNAERKFLDWEYIFKPDEFTHLSGNRWKVFRKNVRKWPQRNPGYVFTSACYDAQQVRNFLAEWMERKRAHVQDAELLANFAHFSRHPGIGRKYLYTKSRRLKAIVAWDENWAYVNFRICMTDGTDWLNEFARYLFYTDPLILRKGKLVNDGGALGSKGLERFKDKMNPLYKRPIYSLKIKRNENQET